MRSTLGQLTPYQIDSINEQVHAVLENELPIYVLQTKNIVIIWILRNIICLILKNLICSYIQSTWILHI